MRSPTEGFAIGSYSVTQAISSSTSISVSKLAFYHYIGSTWHIEPADKAATVGAFMDSASTSTSFIENDVQITDISTTPNGDVWAAGYTLSQYQTGGDSLPIVFLYHRSGGVWRLAQTLPNVKFDSIAMTGLASGWIIGSQARMVPDVTNPSAKTTSLTPIAYAWNGARWSPTALPLPVQTGTGFYFQPITATGPSNVWALTTSASAVATPINSADASEHAYLIHYDGSRWSRVSLPRIAVVSSGQADSPFNQVYFQRIATAPNGDLWLAGQLFTDPNPDNKYIPLFYQYTGGQWVSLPLPKI